jgi:hypothetical protein
VGFALDREEVEVVALLASSSGVRAKEQDLLQDDNPMLGHQ